jgi:hypothetical protein
LLALRVAFCQETRIAKSEAFMLSQQALQEFKKLWQEEYGEHIPDDFAVAEGINLLTLFDAIHRPVKKEWLDESSENPL